jgi:hypothetical protein
VKEQQKKMYKSAYLFLFDFWRDNWLLAPENEKDEGFFKISRVLSYLSEMSW